MGSFRILKLSTVFLFKLVSYISYCQNETIKNDFSLLFVRLAVVMALLKGHVCGACSSMASCLG